MADIRDVGADTLIVSDDPTIHGSIFDNIKKKGIVISVARNGHSLLNQLQTRKPDLIFLDFRLPETDGIALCKQLKANDGGIPVVLMFASEDIDRRAQGFRAGAVDYLIKPLVLEEVLAKVGLHVGKKTMPLQSASQYRRGVKLSRHNPDDAERSDKALNCQVCAELPLQERYFREIFYHAAEATSLIEVMSDRTFRFLETNRAFENLMNTPLGSLRGRKVSDAFAGINSATADVFLAMLERCLEAGATIRQEHTMVFPSGLVSMHSGSTPMFDASGRIEHILVITRDITERKRMEAEVRSHLHFFESMDRINRAIQGSNDLEAVLCRVLDEVLAIFGCDRAYLVYPCDPEAGSWQVPMERTRPEYPGALALGKEIPMDEGGAASFRLMLSAEGPVTFGAGNQYALPEVVAEQFDIKSFMAMAIYPKADKPWQFGIHQCSSARGWTADEYKLFQEIGRRLADGLSSLLAYRTLQTSEREYRTLVDNVPLNVARYDVQGRITYLNPPLEKLLNITTAEARGKRPTDCLSDPYYNDYEKRLLQVAASGEMLRVEWEGPGDDGPESGIITLVAERDENGDINGVLAIGIVLTEQRRMETALQRSDALYSSTVSAMIEGVIVQSQDGNILSINPAAEKILGLSMGQGIGNCPLYGAERVLAADGKPFPEDQCPAMLAFRTGRPQFDVEMGLCRAEGGIVWILVNSQPLFADGKFKPYAVVSTFHNITEKKRAESERLNAIAILKENEVLLMERLKLERSFSQMANHVPGFLYTLKVDAEGHGSFVYVSSGVKDIYGVLPDVAEDDMSTLHNMAHPGDRLGLDAAISKAVRNVALFHYEFRICHPAKGVLWIEAKAMPTLKDDGSIVFHGFMQDITERKRMENTLKFIAQSGWQESREAFLISLAVFTGQMLEVDYVLISKLTADPDFIETIVVCSRGEILPNMRYRLAGTPSDNVIDGRLCCCPENAQQLFPEDTLLADMRVESYAGLPLRDSRGNPIGLISVMDGKPMPDSNKVVSILQLVAIRVAAELERDKFERALAESRQFLHRVIDTLAEPVFVKNRRHRWILVNSAFSKLIGQPRESMLGKSDYHFFSRQEGDEFWARDEEVFRSGEENVHEDNLTDRNGVTRSIITKKTRYIDDNGEGVLVGIMLDITERKQLEATIRKREEEFRTLAENLPDVIIRYDKSLRLTYINKGYSKMLESMSVDVLGKTPQECWWAMEPSAEHFTRLLQQVIVTGNPETALLQAETSAGKIVYWSMNLVPEFDLDGRVNGILSCATDVTALKEYQREVEESRSQLRALASRNEKLREEERKHIARELHDDLGQRLTALKLDLSRLTLRFGQDNQELQQQIREMETDIGATIQIVRDVATSLRPSTLEMGIVSALQWLVQEFRKRTHIYCRLRFPDQKLTLDDSQATALFRIVQESLTNIMRYAMASEVEISLSSDDKYYVLSIGDNGVGLDASQKHKNASFGLMGIEERALSLGGDISIETARNKGMKLTVRIPVLHAIGEHHDQSAYR